MHRSHTKAQPLCVGRVVKDRACGEGDEGRAARQHERPGAGGAAVVRAGRVAHHEEGVERVGHVQLLVAAAVVVIVQRPQRVVTTRERPAAANARLLVVRRRVVGLHATTESILCAQVPHVPRLQPFVTRQQP